MKVDSENATHVSAMFGSTADTNFASVCGAFEDFREILRIQRLRFDSGYTVSYGDLC